MRKMKAAELVLDFDLYPRMDMDAKNVSDLVSALASGSELPPVIIDKKTKRVVDGFHRVKSHLRFYGDDAEIIVIERTYRTEAELFLDAMRYNAGHGAKLHSYDKSRCLLLSEKLGISAEDVAGALSISADRLESLRTDHTATAGNLTVPLKTTIKHMAGRKLTKRQQQANTKLSGMNQKFYVNQVIELLESGLIDESDESLAERLQHLHGLLEVALTAH